MFSKFEGAHHSSDLRFGRPVSSGHSEAVPSIWFSNVVVGGTSKWIEAGYPNDRADRFKLL